jgi:predicted metal-binding membrane protein
MPTQAANPDLPHRPLTRVLAHPRAIALACVAVLVAAGWIYLGLVLAGETARGFLSALCQPLYGAEDLSATALLLTLAMWCAMALAMMLPTAAPMILTYADLAETAARKGEPAASPIVLAAGYIAVWFAAAVALAALQAVLARFGLLDNLISVASPLFAGALFLLAGVYQFSALKHACVTQCQHPFRFFFANWTADPRGVFRLGLRQGRYCLGCCWAMMLLMFAIGVMSVFWMAMLGAIMASEKVAATTRFSKVLGALFCLIGFAIVVSAMIERWPVKSAAKAALWGLFGAG